MPIRGTDPQEGAPVECAAQHSTGRDGTIPSAKEKDSYGGSDAHVKPLKTDSPTSVNFVLGRLLHPRTATVHGCMFQVASRAIGVVRRALPICLLACYRPPDRMEGPKEPYPAVNSGVRDGFMGHGSSWSKI